MRLSAPGPNEDLRSYLVNLVGNLNLVLQGIDESPIKTIQGGTPNEIATGTAEKTAVVDAQILMNGHAIRGLPMPRENNDAATVEYVQQVIAGRL